MPEQLARSPVPPGRLALSPSKLAALACPYRFRALYLLDEQDPKDHMLLVGSLVHEVAGAYMERLRETRRGTDLDFLHAVAEHHWRHRDHAIPEEAFEDFGLFVARLGEYIAKPEAIVDIEYALAFREDWTGCEWEDPEAAWGGMIDVWSIEGKGQDARAIVEDWTTASLAGVFGHRKDLQTRQYGLLIHKATRIDNVEVKVRSLRTGAVRELSLGPEDHEQTERRLVHERERLVALIALDDPSAWPAVPGHQCGICNLHCPAIDAMPSELPMKCGSAEQAEEALGRLILLDRVRRAHTKALRGWIQFRGPVHAPGKVAEFRPGESRLWDLPAVLEVLQEHGIQPGEVLNVDARRIKKLSKEARRALDQHVTKGVKEKFGVYSTEGDDEEENGGGE